MSAPANNCMERGIEQCYFFVVAKIAKYKIRHNDCDSIYVIIKPSITLRTKIIKRHVPSAIVNA